MNIFEALILGVLQGITEFLPVSSSGHLVILQRVFDISEGALSFDIALHFATLIPIFLIFRKDIYDILRRPIRKITLLYIVGSIPIAAAGYFLGDSIEAMFETGKYLGIAFLITGLVLMLSNRAGKKVKSADDLSVIDAFIIGIFQACAAVPGISRSGMTISGGLLRGMKKPASIKFAFLLGTPAILGAALKDIADSGMSGVSEIGVLQLIIGMTAAGIFGYLAIRFMLSVFSRIKIWIFACYVGVLGVLVLIDQLFFNVFFGKLC